MSIPPSETSEHQTRELATPDAAPLVLDAEKATRERYSAAAHAREAALCCPVDYDRTLLEAIPDEVIERDYGCGDPSRYVRPGETVLDLGSGGGKICFIASQIVGPKGRVIGVDMNDEMLELARRAAPQVAHAIGHANVEFRRGRIQDLKLDVDRLDAWLASHPVSGAADLSRLDDERERIGRVEPLVAGASVDLIVSNCVLNLVREEEKGQLIEEMFRVLRPGGRIAISDIVSDEIVPAHLREDPELWSGCVSGAFHELDLLERLEAAGFHGVEIDKWEPECFAVVEGIEFRSVTVTAHKSERGDDGDGDGDGGQAILYKGPWKQVMDDSGRILERGVRTAVSARGFAALSTEPYADQVVAIEPALPVPVAERPPFDTRRREPRDPRETKGGEHRLDGDSSEGSCC